MGNEEVFFFFFFQNIKTDLYTKCCYRPTKLTYHFDLLIIMFISRCIRLLHIQVLPVKGERLDASRRTQDFIMKTRLYSFHPLKLTLYSKTGIYRGIH